MTAFKPGDRVRRINDNWAGVKVGDVHTVAYQATDALYLEGKTLGYSPENFELVYRADPVMEVVEPEIPDPVNAFRLKLIPLTENGLQLSTRGVNKPVPTDPAEFEDYAEELAAIVRATVLYVLSGVAR